MRHNFSRHSLIISLRFEIEGEKMKPMGHMDLKPKSSIIYQETPFDLLKTNLRLRQILPRFISLLIKTYFFDVSPQ